MKMLNNFNIMKTFRNKGIGFLLIWCFFAHAQSVHGATLAYGFGDWLRGGDDEWRAPRQQSTIGRLAEQARDGDVDAMRQMGIISMKGQGVKPSARIAAQWFKKAAERGDSRSMMYLGDMHRGGNGVSKSNSMAMRYYADAYRRLEHESDDIIQGDSDNVLIKRIKKIPLSESISWWKQRAEMGDVYAMYYLATRKEKELNNYLTKEQADKYMDMAAIHGHPKAIKAVENESPDKHLTYWADKAEKDDMEAWMKYAIALYKDGNCSENEEWEAMRYAQKAADRDYLEAKSWLAELHKKQVDKCTEYLLSGEHAKACRILDKLRKNGNFDAIAVLESVLTNKSASAESIRLLNRYISTTSTESDTPIILLAVQNMQTVEVIQALVSIGYNVNDTHKETGETALIAAAKNCDVPAVQFLLQTSNIDVSIRDKTNKDALAYASEDKIRQLLEDSKSRKERESEPHSSQETQPVTSQEPDIQEKTQEPEETVQENVQPKDTNVELPAIKKEKSGGSIWVYIAGGGVAFLILGGVLLIVLKKKSSANKSDASSAAQGEYGMDDTLPVTPPPFPGMASSAVPPPLPQQVQPASPPPPPMPDSENVPPPPIPVPGNMPPPPPWQQ